MKGTKIPGTLADVCRVMVVGFDDTRSIKLHDDVSMQISVDHSLYAMYRNQLSTIFTK